MKHIEKQQCGIDCNGYLYALVLGKDDYLTYANLVCAKCGREYGWYEIKLKKRGYLWNRQTIIVVPYVTIDTKIFPYPTYQTKHQVGVMAMYNRNVTESMLDEYIDNAFVFDVYGEGVNCNMSY